MRRTAEAVELTAQEDIVAAVGDGASDPIDDVHAGNLQAQSSLRTGRGSHEYAGKTTRFGSFATLGFPVHVAGHALPLEDERIAAIAEASGKTAFNANDRVDRHLSRPALPVSALPFGRFPLHTELR